MAKPPRRVNGETVPNPDYRKLHTHIKLTGFTIPSKYVKQTVTLILELAIVIPKKHQAWRTPR